MIIYISDLISNDCAKRERSERGALVILRKLDANGRLSVCVSVCLSVTPKNDLLNNNRILQTALNDLRAKNRPHSIKGSFKNPIVVMKVVFLPSDH